MGNADYEVDQPFWMVVEGLLHTVVWSQLVSVVILAVIMTGAARLLRLHVRGVTVFAASLFGSFFTWFHVSDLYDHVVDPAHHSGLMLFNLPTNPLFVPLFLGLFMPAMFNQASLLIAFCVLPLLWTLSAIQNHAHRRVVYAALIMMLPAAWFLDFFNTAPN